MKLKYLLLTFAISWAALVGAQVNEHDHDSDQEHHHKREIGIANMAVYFSGEKTYAYGLHLHFVQQISESAFGLGLGYERIFDDHQHQTVGIVAAFRPIDRLTISASPGLAFESEVSAGRFALHLEAVYEFELGDYHIGPLFEVAYDPEDVHLSLGLHIGYGF